MKLARLVLPFIITMIFFIGMPQSASAFEAEVKECAVCHKDVTANKVAMSDLNVTVAKQERQILTGFSQPEQLGFYGELINYNTNHATLLGAGSGDKYTNANYLTGYKSRPGWQA